MLNKVLEVLVQFLASGLLRKLVPANVQPYLEKFEAVLPIAIKAIQLAHDSGEDNATKKKIAAEALLAALKANNLDIPGDADLQVCEILVEGVYQALKKFNPSSAK